MGPPIVIHGEPAFHPPAFEGTPPVQYTITYEQPHYAAPKPGEGATQGAGSGTPLSTRAGVNIFQGKRAYLATGAGVGLGLAGLGLGVGLTEGVPRALGGQGPIGAALNPDEKKDPNDPLGNLTGNPLTLLVIGAIVVALVVLK